MKMKDMNAAYRREGITTTKSGPCDASLQRLCQDGTCISQTDPCPEDELMSQDTILIMIGVGMGVVIFLVILYCLQQRRNTPLSELPVEGLEHEMENPELMVPPPSYDEALNVTLYPPTPQTQRSRRIPSIEEPITPPPNYDAALHILAQSQNNIFTAKGTPRASPVVRRSLSVDQINRKRSNIPLMVNGDRQSIAGIDD